VVADVVLIEVCVEWNGMSCFLCRECNRPPTTINMLLVPATCIWGSLRDGCHQSPRISVLLSDRCHQSPSICVTIWQVPQSPSISVLLSDRCHQSPSKSVFLSDENCSTAVGSPAGSGCYYKQRTQNRVFHRFVSLNCAVFSVQND
jgi:hypothetical protein